MRYCENHSDGTPNHNPSNAKHPRDNGTIVAA
jgi:hypothetical protein